MKWPLSITLIRHAQSQYNILRTKKEQDPEYEHFKALHGKDPDSPLARVLAGKMQSKYALDTSDYKTPLSTAGVYQARDTGRRIFAESVVPVPDVILVSPYVRTRTTLNLLKNGAGETHFTKAVEVVDERIREQ